MLRKLLPLFVFGAALVAAGCGGGSGGSALNPLPAPTPTNVPVGPTPASVTLYGGSYSLTFTVPATVSGSGSVSAILQTSPPSGVPAPTSQLRRPNSKTTKSLGPVTPLIYLSVTPSADITFAKLPSFLYTLPIGNSIPAGQQAYTEFWDPATSQWLPALGPGTVAGSPSSGVTVTFPSVAGGVALKAGSTYLYALVQTVSAAPTASPTPVPTATPTPGGSPTPTPTPSTAFATCPSTGGSLFPMVIQNNTGISSGSKITIYAYGLSGGQWDYLTDATSGTLQALPASGSQVPSFTVSPNTCLNLPPLISARVYMVLGGQTINLVSNGSGNGVAAPDPWSVNRAGNTPTVNNTWDFLEYTWGSTSQSFNIDTTQVDAIGIPVSFQAVNTISSTSGTVFGMQSNAVTNLANDLTFSLGIPWSGLIQNTQNGKRVISPQHAVNIPNDSGTLSSTPPPNAPTLSANYWDGTINQVWSTYQGTNYFYPSYGSTIPSGTYGVVDSTNTFNFYQPGVATPIASFTKPTTWDVFNNAGPFTANQSTAALNIGRALVVGIERGTLPVPSGIPYGPTVPQPYCGMSDWQYFYGYPTTKGGTVAVATVTANWYSALMHKFGRASVPGLPGLAYAFPDDDECNNSAGNALYAPDTSASYSNGQQWNVTLNPL